MTAYIRNFEQIEFNAKELDQITKYFPEGKASYFEAAAKLAGPHDTILTFGATDPDEHKLSTAIQSIEACGCVFVTGVYVKTDEGTKEILDVYNTFLGFLRSTLLPKLTEKAYILYLGEKSSKAPHPKLVADIKDNKLTLDGGMIMPGYLEPAAVTILNPVGNRMVSGVMGSHASNFHKLLRETTPERMGCTDLPEELMNYPLTTAEQMIHLFKVAAAHLLPKFRKQEPDAADKASALFERLKTEPDLKQQKDIGRNAPLIGQFFPTFNTLNNRIMAMNLIVRMACGDKDLERFFAIIQAHDNRVVEAAVHGGKDNLQGDFRDTTWGSMGASAQICFRPDMLTKPGEKIIGVFEAGIDLVHRAGSGDQEALQTLGLHEPLTDKNLLQCGALIFSKIWKDISAAHDRLEA